MTDESMPTATFAEALEHLMRSRRLSQAELARELDVYDGNVSRWRRGHGIDIDNVRRIADFFGVDRGALERLAGYPEAEESVRPLLSLNPRLAALLAQIEAGWEALDDTEREIAERGALALFAVRQGATGQMRPGATEQDSGVANRTDARKRRRVSGSDAALSAPYRRLHGALAASRAFIAAPFLKPRSRAWHTI